MNDKLYSWRTWKKRNNPVIYRSHDGVLPIRYNIEPTLLAHGFHYIGDEETFFEIANKRVQAERMIDEYRQLTCAESYDEFVYWVHYGSRNSSMPMLLYVYGRKDKRAQMPYEGGAKEAVMRPAMFDEEFNLLPFLTEEPERGDLCHER